MPRLRLEGSENYIVVPVVEQRLNRAQLGTKHGARKPQIYTGLAQWIEHLATNQGFVGVRLPYPVPHKSAPEVQFPPPLNSRRLDIRRGKSYDFPLLFFGVFYL